MAGRQAIRRMPCRQVTYFVLRTLTNRLDTLLNGFHFMYSVGPGGFSNVFPDQVFNKDLQTLIRLRSEDLQEKQPSSERSVLRDD